MRDREVRQSKPRVEYQGLGCQPWPQGLGLSQGEGMERFKLVCHGRRHRTERIITRRILERVYSAARREGLSRIRSCDLHRMSG